jgi:hypothetical protein
VLIADSVRAAHALASRLESEFIGWSRREGTAVPPAARELARLTLAIARAMRVELEKLAAEVASGSPPDLDAVVGLNQRAQIAETLHTFLDNSTHKTLHPVLSPTVRTELTALGVSGQVLVCGTRDVSYELLTIARDPFAKLVPANELSKFDWPFLIFRVPNTPLDWPLHHVLLYHEIGHALQRAQPDLPAPQPPPQLDPAQTQDLMRRVEFALLQSAYMKAMTSWLEELYADVVGLLLSGPAYFVAFSRLLGGFFPIDNVSVSHPPTALRIRLLGETLSKFGLLAALPGTTRPLVDEWLARAQTATKYAPVGDLNPKLIPLLVQAAEAAHPGVIAAAAARVGGRAYTASLLAEDGERGRLLRELKIPPIEQDALPPLTEPGQPLPPARIFSAVWAAFLEQTSGASPPLAGVASAAEQYARVLLGALDGAEALRAWREP